MPRKAKTALAPPTRRQGRPAAAEAGIGRRKLIDATRDLLRNVPLDQLTAGEIARAAGGDRALVRYYFGDLSALVAEALEEAVEQLSAELLARVEAATAGPGSPSRRLARRVHEFVRFQLENPAAHRLFIDQIVNAHTRWGRRIRDSNWQRGITVLRGLIKEGQAAGEFRRHIDARLLEIAIIGLSEFVVRARPILRLLLAPEEDLASLTETYAGFAAELVIGGIAARSGKPHTKRRR